MSSAWYGRGALASESLDRLLRASGSRSAESTRRAARPSTSTSTPMFKKLPIRRSRRRLSQKFPGRGYAHSTTTQ